MADHLSHFADRHPDRPAIIDDRQGEGEGRRVLTYAELDAETNRWAHAIVSAGLRPGQSVGWCGPNSMETLLVTHAARRSGTTAVPVPYKLTEAEAHYIADHSEIAAVWVAPGYEHLVPPGITRLEASDDARALDPTIASELTELILYTSGTTGRPKGARRSTGGTPGHVGSLLELIWDDEPHRYLTTGPLYHSGPIGFALRSHLIGATVVTQPAFDAEDWLRLVDEYAITTTFSAPTPIRRVTALASEVRAKYDVSSMRSMIANAAPWTMALKEAYLDMFPAESLWEVYGSTELSVSTVMHPADHLRKPGSCGQLAPGVEHALFDPDGVEITTPHTEGELFVRSPAVFKEYFKNPDEFAANRRGDWQTVGDIAYFDEDGFWYICDRKKDMVISGGANVYPAEVENALDSHPEVAEVAVIGLPDEEWGEVVHAVIVPRDADAPPAADDLRSYARERLAGYKTPKSFSFLAVLPKTGSGKVLKRQLRTDLGG